MKESSREKRRYRRFPCNLPLQYRAFGPDTPGNKGGFTRDIAEGGIRFVANRFIPVATNLTLDVNLSTTPQHLKATSKVVWVRKLREGDRYEVGLEFTEISDDDRRRVRTITHPEEPPKKDRDQVSDNRSQESENR